MPELEHLLAVQNQLGEGPIWNHLEGALYWVDIAQGNFHRLDPHTGKHDVTEVGVPVGVMGFRARGGLVMATKRGFGLWDMQKRSLEIVADPESAGYPEGRFNDGSVDRKGRFWAGTMHKDYTASLYRLDADFSCHRMETGIHTSNGTGWSPDNRTFYFTDSPLYTIYAYDYDFDSGEISNRRVFAKCPEGQGYPDGLAVDSEGYVWSARWGGWKIVRHAPDGSVEREIKLPVELVTSCTFGGAQLDELYITSAWIDIKPEKRASQPLAGDLFRLKVGIKGLPASFFAG
jgi:sugar lactone lactonase YvrE